MSLKTRAIRAVRWTAISAAVTTILKLAQIAVLARLLTPSDFGLMALVVVVIHFTTVFSDLGLSSAFVSRRRVKLSERSSLFWLNIVVAVFLSIVVLVMAPLFAGFFNEPDLKNLIPLSTLAVVFSAFGQHLRVAAQKEFKFGPLATVEILSTLFGFLVAILVARAGYGVYALVWAAISSAAVSSLVSWMVLANDWRPSMRLNLHELKPYLAFGGAVLGNELVRQVHTAMDLLIGGKLLPANTLGLYSMSRNLVLQPQLIVNLILTKVGFPLIAKVQENLAYVKKVYLNTLNFSGSINAPLFLCVAYFSSEIVEVFLGENWAATTEILRTLALWGWARSTGNPVGSLLLGTGRARLALYWNLGVLILLVPILFVGAHYGVLGLAYSMLVFQLLLMLPGWYVLVRPACGVGVGEYTFVILKPAILAAISIGFSSVLYDDFFKVAIWDLLVALGLVASIYVLLSYLFNRVWLVSVMHLVGINASKGE